MAAKLTELKIAKAIAGPTRVEIPAAVQGLILRGKAGTGQWAWRRMVNGSRTRLGLGEYPAVSLAEATQRALDLNAAVDRGEDVVAQARRTTKSGMTVQQALDRYSAEVLKVRRGQRAMSQVLAKFLDPFLSRPAMAVTHAEIGKRYHQRKSSAPSAARLAVRYLAPMWAWLHLEGEVDFTIAIKTPAPNKRERVLEVAELAAIWNATEAEAYPAKQIVRLLILTGLRLNEVAGLRRSEVDLANGLLRLPAERMKAGRPFDVPLAAIAKGTVSEALSAAPEGCPVLFTTNGATPFSGWTRLKARIDKASGVSSWTWHDFRRSIASLPPTLGLADAVVCDLILAHRPQSLSRVSAHYFKSAMIDQRRDVAEKWASLITTEAAGAALPKLKAVQ